MASIGKLRNPTALANELSHFAKCDSCLLPPQSGTRVALVAVITRYLLDHHAPVGLGKLRGRSKRRDEPVGKLQHVDSDHAMAEQVSLDHPIDMMSDMMYDVQYENLGDKSD